MKVCLWYILHNIGLIIGGWKFGIYYEFFAVNYEYNVFILSTGFIYLCIMFLLWFHIFCNFGVKINQHKMSYQFCVCVIMHLKSFFITCL